MGIVVFTAVKSFTCIYLYLHPPLSRLRVKYQAYKLGVLIAIWFGSFWFAGVRFRLACGGGVLSLVGSALRVIGPGVA